MSDPVSTETNRSDESDDLSDDLIKDETVLETGEGIVSILH